MRPVISISILILSALGNAVCALAQSTAFTYHGRLNNNGAPVTGAYDMQFSVYDADDAGVLVAGPLPANAVGVTNGLFTLRIDFLAGVFTGPPRWIEISVRPAGAGGFQTLSPRQELTSSPYSIRAQSAGTAADVSNGAVVKSLNNLRDNITLAAGTNVTLVPNGNTLTIASAGVGIWSVNGNNAYYNAGMVGIGTNNPSTRLTVAGAGAYNSPFAAAITLDNTTAGRRWEWHALDDGRLQLADFTLAATRMVIDTAGNVGIGTVTPAHKLTINYPGFGLEHAGGNVRLGTYVSDDGTNTDGGWLGTISNHKLHFFVNNGQPSMTVSTAGDVGIGTTTPARKLTVFSPLYGIEHTDGTVRLDTYINANGGWLGTISSHPLHFFVSDGLPRMTVDTTGSVGIGTTLPSAKLSVNGEANGVGIAVTGNATQSRDKGGWVKAMLYVNANGTIARCYNGITGAATGGCGFTVNHDGPGDYNVLLGFPTSDRFATVTAHGYEGTLYYGPNVNGISVYTANLANTPVDCAFTLIVY